MKLFVFIFLMAHVFMKQARVNSVIYAQRNKKLQKLGSQTTGGCLLRSIKEFSVFLQIFQRILKEWKSFIFFPFQCFLGNFQKLTFFLNSQCHKLKILHSSFHYLFSKLQNYSCILVKRKKYNLLWSSARGPFFKRFKSLKNDFNIFQKKAPIFSAQNVQNNPTLKFHPVINFPYFLSTTEKKVKLPLYPIHYRYENMCTA